MTGRGFWHPFANMAATERGRVVFVEGRGTTLIDAEGRRYFDATASLWYSAVGHGRVEIADAIRAQAVRLEACSCFDVYASDVTLDLADRLAEMVPVDDASVFFTSGGSDSVDTAAKIVRRYFALRGQPERMVMIAREGAYHGMHAYGTSLAGIPGNREGWGELVAGIALVPPFDVAALESTIRSVGPDRVGAFFVEPVIGAGGIFPPPDDYLREVARVCRQFGVLLVCDEVITGLGRTGSWFASERYGVRPDLLLLAKILTSGYQPLGAVVVSGAIAAPFHDGDGALLRHGYTYSGHATACAAALANLDILEREGLVTRVEELGRQLPVLLRPLLDLDVVQEIRTVGLTAAIQLDADRLTERGVTVADVVVGCRERGQLTRALASGALQFSPPFVSTVAEIERFATSVNDALRAPATRRVAA